MSRIGNRILNIPKNTSIQLQNNNLLIITGIKGTIIKKLSNIIKINIDEKNQTIITNRLDNNKKTKQLHGTINSLINNMLIGVTIGFTKELEINGVGYRANLLQSDNLNLILGFSHSINFKIPLGIKIILHKPTLLQIIGIDKQLVGEVAAQIRNLRKPEPYKGKGIKYKNEYIRLKEGKAAGKNK